MLHALTSVNQLDILFFRNNSRATVIHTQVKWVSKNGVEDKLGAVTLKKSPQKVVIGNDDATIERLLASGDKKK